MAADPRLEALRRAAEQARRAALPTRDPQVRVENTQQEVPDPRASQVPRPPAMVDQERPPEDPRLEALRRSTAELRSRTDFSGLSPELRRPVEEIRRDVRAERGIEPPRSRVVELLRSTLQEPFQGRGVGDTFKAAARVVPRAIGGMVEGVGQAAQAVQGGFEQLQPKGRERVLPERQGPTLRSAGRATEQTGSRIRELFPESQRTAQGETFQPKNPLWWIERGGEAVTQLGVQLGLAAATGGASPATQFAAFAAPTAVLEGGNAYRAVKDAALERGASEEEAEHFASGSAALTAAGSTALETLPFAQFVFRRIPGTEKLWGKLFAGGLARRAAGDVVASMTVEGIEEAAQEAWGATIAATVGENPDAFQDITMRMIAAGALGAGAGGVAAVGQNAVHGPPTPQGFGTPSEDAVRQLITPEAREARRREASELATARLRPPQAPPGGPTAAPGTPEPPQVDPGANAAVAVPRETPGLRRRVAELVDPSLKPELQRLYTDPLTGMGNEAAHAAALERVNQDPEREWVRVDLTNFKAINDAMGWAAGDKRIREVADQVRGIAQRYGVEPRDLFRAKGDEIDIVVPRGQGEQLGREIEEAVRPFQVEGTDYESRARFGVGATLEEANTAANAKKATETGPRARHVEKPVSAPPQAALTAPEAKGVDQKLPPEAVGDSDTYFVHPSSLQLDPDRFQFKDFLTPTGETGALKGVEKWDETRAGVVSAWRDPANGKLYVVNGHQRTNLANRLGAERLRVMEIQAPSAEHAKVMGALINIGEGSGTAVDAAKVMRSQKLGPEELRAQGVPMTGAVARDGLALSNLDEGLFSLVARGKLTVSRGAIFGRSGLTPPQQQALFALVSTEEEKGKELTNGQVEELAKFVRGAGSAEATQETLFGTESVDMSLAIEKAKLSSWVKGELRKTAAAFRDAAKRGRAETLARAGVGTIDQARARELAGDAEVVLEVYDRLSASAGPVSDVLNRGVRELREGAKPDEVRAAVLAQVSQAVEETLAGGARAGVPGGPESAPSDPSQAALFDERARYEVGRRRPEVMGGEVSNRNQTAKKLEAKGFGRMQVDIEFDPYHGEPWALDNAAFRQWNAKRQELGLDQAEFIARGSPGVEYDRTRFYELYVRALKIAQADPSKAPRFAVIPDQVGNAEATLMDAGTFLSDLNYERRELLSDEAASIIDDDPWATRGLRYSSVPLYLPVQNGITPELLEKASEPGGWLYDVEQDRSFLQDVAGIFLGGDDAYKSETAEAWSKWAHARGLKFHYARAGTGRKLRHAYQVGADSVDSALPQRSSRTWRAFTGELERLEGQGELGLKEERGDYQVSRNPYPQMQMYSRLERAIERAPQERMTPEQWLGYLDPSKRGFSSSEEEWVGLRAAIQEAESKGRVTKADLLKAVQARGIKLTETVYGGADEMGEALAETAEAAMAAFRARRDDVIKAMEAAGYHRASVERWRNANVSMYLAPVTGPGSLEADALERVSAEKLHDFKALLSTEAMDALGFDSPSDAVRAVWPENRETADSVIQAYNLTDQEQAAYMAWAEAEWAAGLARTDRGPDAVQKAFDRAVSAAVVADNASNRLRRHQANPNAGPRTSYRSYSVPSGQDYTEITIQLDRTAKDAELRKLGERYSSVSQAIDAIQNQDEDADERRRELMRQRSALAVQIDEERARDRRETFNSSHWTGRDILAHVRFTTHYLPQSRTRFGEPAPAKQEKVLLVNEIQSDWHQEGRKYGYRRKDLGPEEKWAAELVPDTLRVRHPTDPSSGMGNYKVTDDQGRLWGEIFASSPQNAVHMARKETAEARTPDAPFKATGEWVELVLKRIIEQAVQSGSDRVAILNGRNVATLMDLTEEVDQLELVPAESSEGSKSPVWILTARMTDSRGLRQFTVTSEQLPQYVGPEVARTLLEREPSVAEVQPYEGMHLGQKVTRYTLVDQYDQALRDQDDNALNNFETLEQATAAAEEWNAQQVRVLDQEQMRQAVMMGGEGEVGFYDDLVLKETQKYLRAIKGPKLERIEGLLEGDPKMEDVPLWSFPITREMRDMVEGEGQRLMEGGPDRDYGAEWQAKLRDDVDLFGQRIRPEEPAQGSLLEQPKSLQGMTEAVANARAIVSALEGRVTRGAASAEDTRRFQEARALLRRAEGKGIDPRELEPRAGTERDPYTGDLFGEVKEPTGPQIQAELALVFGSAEKAAEVNVETLKRAGPFADIILPGIRDVTARIAAVRKGKAAFVKVDAVGKRVGGKRGIDKEAVLRLLQSYRHPSAEYLHILVAVDGRIVHHRMTTTGSFDTSLVYQADIAEAAAVAARLGGEVIMAHNHPSGDPRPSPEDKQVTLEAERLIQLVGARSGGHYIINHLTATHLEGGFSQPLAIASDRGDWNDPRARTINGPGDVAAYLSKLPMDHTRLDVLFLDTRHRTVAFEARPIRDLDTIAEWLPGLRREAAAPTVILGVGSSGAMRFAAVKIKGLPIGVLDIIDAESGRSAQEIGIYESVNSPVSAVPVHEERPRYEVRDREGKAAPTGRPKGPALDVAPRLGSIDPRSISGLREQFKQLEDRPRVDPEPLVAGGVVPDEKLDAVIGGTTLRPVSPVELTRIAFELLGSQRAIFVKRLARWRGAMYPYPGAPKIGLNAAIGRDYEGFAATLAHEIGHLVDFLPDETMTRGNLLGRIATLRSYLQESLANMPSNPAKALTPKERAAIRRAAEKVVTKAIGSKPKDKTKAIAWGLRLQQEYRSMLEHELNARGLIGLERVTEELILVSEWWRGPIAGSDSYVKYRRSSPELYADALSVLLNSPGSLQTRAPTFFEAFLEYFERKPDVKAVYEAIQAEIAGGDDVFFGVRREQLDEDVDRGEKIRRELEERPDPQSWSSYLEQLFSSSAAPATRAERGRVKPDVAQDNRLDVKHALQEFNHADNVNRLMLADLVRQVDQPMKKAGLSEKDAHEYLLMTRVAYGDRGGMAEEAKEDIMARVGAQTWAEARELYKALEKSDPLNFDPELLARAESGILNPRGYTPDEAQRNLDQLEKKLGPEKWKVLQDSMTTFRDILFRSVREAVRVGSYNQVTYQTKLLPNSQFYATFSVLEYFEGRVPAGVKRQIGTVKAVGSTYTSSILKAMALNRLNELQRAKQAVLGVIDVDFPGTAGPVRAIDKYNREKPPSPGKENLIFLQDGKAFYREVDPYIARMFDRMDIGSLTRLTQLLGMRTYQVFHPLYVTLSIAWQVRNVARDWQRTYQNIAAAHAGKPTYKQVLEALLDFGRLNKAYVGAVGASWRHAKQQHDPMIREMIEQKALGRAFHSFDPVGDTTMERLAQRYGFVEEGGPPPSKGKALLRYLSKKLETFGVFQETLSKAAAWKYLEGQGVLGRERAYIVRNYTGTPDSRLSGLASEATNAVFLYANVTIAGLRADLEVATQPKTAGGWWLRALLTNFGPKLLMAAALFGWLDQDDDDEASVSLSEWFRHVPTYDLEKYVIIPLPPFIVRNERGETKAVYMRWPHMDTDRALAGIFWSTLVEQRPNRLPHAVGVGMGELPGLSPAIDLPVKNLRVLGDTNPIDYFYGRQIIPRTEWEAGGWPRYRELLRYDLQQLGIISQVLGRWVYQSPEESEAAPGEEFLRSVPGLSSLVRISDRGLNEERYWEEDADTRLRARLRSGLGASVRRGLSERSNLNRLGVENLDDQELTRRATLNAWYSQVYIPETEEMERAREAGDDAAFRAAGERIETELNAILGTGGP